MGKNSDTESLSNSISKTILHEILLEYSNKPESKNHLKKEEIEYRGQSMKKISKINLKDNDKKVIRDKVIRKIKNRLKTKYNDIIIPQGIITKKVNQELYFFFQ